MDDKSGDDDTGDVRGSWRSDESEATEQDMADESIAKVLNNYEKNVRKKELSNNLIRCATRVVLSRLVERSTTWQRPIITDTASIFIRSFIPRITVGHMPVDCRW